MRAGARTLAIRVAFAVVVAIVFLITTRVEGLDSLSQVLLEDDDGVFNWWWGLLDDDDDSYTPVDGGNKTRLGWVDPKVNGGDMIDFTAIWKGEVLGEPINVIISGNSDPRVLTLKGLREYSISIGLSGECLGIHVGTIHTANLGDGRGYVGEQFLAREWFWNPIYGTCWESVSGGNHFRAWKQNGTLAESGAWFLGVSKELYIGRRHMIAPNGWNLGRDWLVARALMGGSWKGKSWTTEVEWVDGLLEPGHAGINHKIDQDGRVAVLTVTRTDRRVKYAPPSPSLPPLRINQLP